MPKEKTHLFDYYKNTDDKFMRRVVHELKKELRKNDSLELKLTKLGAPLWNVISTVGRETDSVLYIPVKALQQDSITAVLAFVQKNTRQDINVHIITGEGPEQVEGLLNSEFILFFQTALYGQPEYPSGTIIVLDLPDEQKSINIVETCFLVVWEFKSEPNWKCYYSIYLSGSTPEVVLNEENDLDDNIGGGGDPGSNSNLTLIESTNETLVTAKNTLLQYYFNTKFVNQRWLGMTFYIKSDLTAGAGYNYANHSIYFKSWSEVKASTLLHETFHAQQCFFYPNIPQKGAKGYVNIEFETLLYTDIWAQSKGGFANNNHNSWINAVPYSTLESYMKWLNKVVSNPKYYLNSENSEYLDWVEIFRTYYPTYYSEIDADTFKKPFALINLF